MLFSFFTNFIFTYSYKIIFERHCNSSTLNKSLLFFTGWCKFLFNQKTVRFARSLSIEIFIFRAKDIGCL